MESSIRRRSGLPSDSQLQILFRDRLGVRVGPEMSRYAARRLTASPEVFPIIGADARTGVPRRYIVDPNLLAADATAVDSARIY
jgi:hypothetical protein